MKHKTIAYHPGQPIPEEFRKEFLGSLSTRERVAIMKKIRLWKFMIECAQNMNPDYNQCCGVMEKEIGISWWSYDCIIDECIECQDLFDNINQSPTWKDWISDAEDIVSHLKSHLTEAI